jgi:ABC-type transport system substrate-binding protein
MWNHGDTGTKLNDVWKAMISRCYHSSNTSYDIYGGRGIEVCSEWRADYCEFRRWAMSHGYAEGLQIDRIDNDGDYSPENCRFVTRKQQCRNRSSNLLLTMNGITKTAIEWSEETGMKVGTIYSRKSYGWSDEKVLTAPLQWT